MKDTSFITREILVTSALPYLNGRLHLGHMVEAVQADVWTRYQKMQGNRCFYVCGSDAHGTPIMLAAQKQGSTPEVFIAEMQNMQEQDFKDFLINLDLFYTTHSKENAVWCASIYEILKNGKHITKKEIQQFFDPVCALFLPDRFIQGTCPYCAAKKQYGDHCESCGKTYRPEELLDPVSTVSGAQPILKNSEHYFLDLESNRMILKQWIDETGHLQPEVAHKLQEWFSEPLKNWDISRDAPYFGFEIPNAPGKYFYVWFDAPIAYISIFDHLCQKNQTIDFNHFWNKNAKTELHHFIGKDIVYFHSLFWIALLHYGNFRLPNRIVAHGYLTLNGEKMSKSRGTLIEARSYLNCLNPEFFRYYIAAKLSSQIEDLDFNLKDFMIRCHSDLIGKFINLASRCAQLIHKKCDGFLSTELHDLPLWTQFLEKKELICACYEACNYSKAIRHIMTLSDCANRYIDQHQPWSLTNSLHIQLICSQGINLYKILATYLKPVLPETARKTEEFLRCDALNFNNITEPLMGCSLGVFVPWLVRMTEQQLHTLYSQ